MLAPPWCRKWSELGSNVEKSAGEISLISMPATGAKLTFFIRHIEHLSQTVRLQSRPFPVGSHEFPRR
jgi:hypothetical protein